MGPPVAGVDGNWECPACHNVNFANRVECNRCKLPRPAERKPVYVPPPQPAHGGHRIPAPSNGPPVVGVDGNWECGACGNVNFGVRTACNRCKAPRPPPAPPAPPAPPGGGRQGPPVAGVDGNWKCPSCGNVNYAVRTACNRCQAPKPQPQHQQKGPPVAGVDGNWECPLCHNVNYGVRDRCNRCGLDKPAGEGGDQPPVQTRPPPPPVRVPPPATVTSSPGRPGPPVVGLDGNWACSACGNVNYASRSVCNRCQAPKPPEEAPRPQQQQPQQQKGPPVVGVDGNWACPLCNNVNYGVRDRCNRCQLERPAGVVSDRPLVQTPPPPPPVHIPHTAASVGNAGRAGPPVVGVDGNWVCPQCSNVNFGVRTACNRCQAPKPPEESLRPHVVPPPVQRTSSGGHAGGPPVAGENGNWLCPQCQNVNFAVRQVCNRCQAPRPVAAPQPPRGGPKRGPPVAGVDGNWQCRSCGNVNFVARTHCNRCEEPKPPSDEDLMKEYFAQEPLAKKAKV